MFCQASGERNLLSADQGIYIPSDLHSPLAWHRGRMFCQASSERNLLSADQRDRSAAIYIPGALAAVS